MGNLISCRK